ncbi:hypothetical protein LOZ80_16750 [Paenibacillus sp. HWE-109]|uniref:hypothetical protein n=1 Tax=Paenibacillus sp. HWE-109 TaxID=1306526 RepID=UPI001EDD7101|nr:hypothetical protein [Paenibacillus sp. HWE-109]UKS30497.1 hypothetical protein LOZ80_16750 [Paenibacillus sp. HWE-109]
MLVEGIEAHDIVYLKKSALDAAKQLLTVTDSLGARKQIQISKRCVELFQLALDQTKYIVNYDEHPAKHMTTDLRESDDLIKVGIRDFVANRSLITEMDSVRLRTIYMRLRRLAVVFSTPELTYLTTVKLEVKHLALV